MIYPRSALLQMEAALRLHSKYEETIAPGIIGEALCMIIDVPFRSAHIVKSKLSNPNIIAVLSKELLVWRSPRYSAPDESLGGAIDFSTQHFGWNTTVKLFRLYWNNEELVGESNRDAAVNFVKYLLNRRIYNPELLTKDLAL